jgi:hypothetical protein
MTTWYISSATVDKHKKPWYILAKDIIGKFYTIGQSLTHQAHVGDQYLQACEAEEPQALRFFA